MPAILSHALSRSLMRMDQDLTLNTVSLQFYIVFLVGTLHFASLAVLSMLHLLPFAL